MRWNSNKKETFEFIQAHRSKLTLDEIGSQLNLTKQRISQICKDLGIKDRPYRPRNSRLKSQITLVAQ